MYNHDKAQQSKNRVHISCDILYMWSLSMITKLESLSQENEHNLKCVEPRYILFIYTKFLVLIWTMNEQGLMIYYAICLSMLGLMMFFWVVAFDDEDDAMMMMMILTPIKQSIHHCVSDTVSYSFMCWISFMKIKIISAFYLQLIWIFPRRRQSPVCAT